MSVILKKERIQTGEVICQKYSQTTVDCDVIVPDVKPDISKVLEVSGLISVKEKTIRSNKVYIQGDVTMTVLYVPDGDVVGKVKSLTAVQEFNHAVDVETADGSVSLGTEIEAESFSYSPVNSRKVNLRCTMGIGIKITRIEEFEAAVGTDGEQDICVSSARLRLCNAAVNAESRISVCESLELQAGKPAIGEILKTTAFPQSLEFSLSENKATAKGQVRICNLYTSLDDGSLRFSEHTVPFGEIFEIDGAEEDMEGEIEYAVSDIYCEARNDSDGEPRIFGVDIGICASVKGLKIQELDIINDAYSLQGSTKLDVAERNIEQLIDNTTAQLTHKSSLTVSEPLPEISQICDVVSVAYVDRISAENSEITLFGHIQSSVLYVTADADTPLCSFGGSSEFSHTIHVPQAEARTICEAKVFTEHVSYNMSGGNSIDLRTVLGLNVRSFKNEPVPLINDIEISDEEAPKKSACITIYFAQLGDTLWSIAKKYRTTTDSIKRCNGLETDEISVGQEIKICR